MYLLQLFSLLLVCKVHPVGSFALESPGKGQMARRGLMLFCVRLLELQLLEPSET